MPKKRSNFQTKLEYYAVRGILGAIGRLPLKSAVKAGAGLAGLAQKIAGRKTRAAEINLKLALPHLSEEERQNIIRGCYENIGRQVAFASRYARFDAEEVSKLFEVEGIENLEKASADGRGVFIMSAHFGGWEILFSSLPVIGHPATYIVRRLDNPLVNEYAENFRAKFGNSIIDRKNSAKKVSTEILQNSGKIYILPDVNWQEHGSVFVDFFGVSASTATGLAKLTLQNDAVIVPVFAIWQEDKGKYLFKIEPALEFEKTGNTEEDIRTITQKATAMIEKYVRLYPEQWLWIHKRWNTRPKGEANFY